MFELLHSTRTLAVVCAFSIYEAPSKARHRQLQTLERVEPTLKRLHDLLSSERFVAAGIQTEVLLNHSKSELLDRLETIREAVREFPSVNMVVFWSGHGNIDRGSFRLAMRNTFDPIEHADGIGLDEVLRQSGVAQVGTWTMFLDACYAGEGLGDVVGSTHNLLKSETGTLRGYGALCSSAPYERSRDSAFLETVVDVLKEGPSAAVRAYADSVGGGGMLNPFSRLLSVSELFEAISNEYKADTGKYRQAEPWPIQGGAVNPRLFPNPQFHEHQPSRLMENAYRAFARASDLQSHFFPKALGIDNLESGWHFAGRVDATRAILDWMVRSTDRPEDRLYVLAADGGTGKSALLGRLIALTDRQYREKAKAQGWNEVFDQLAGTVPEPDRIDAALSLRNLTPQTLAEHLAGLLGTGPVDSIEGFIEKSKVSYQRLDGAAPCIILDALDEALEPSAIVFRVVNPLLQAGWKLLVATRRTAKAKGANDLVAELGQATVFELDHDEQSWNDIYAYVQGRLQHHNGLATLAELAARLIADRADSKFLFARMATSSLLKKSGPVTPDQLPTLVAKDATEALTQDVAALDEEFKRNFACDGAGATTMLTALAWSEGDGVPIRDGIWAAMAEAVGSVRGPMLRFEERHIHWLLREAGRFIQEAGDGEQAVYRLFHKSLVDHFQLSPFFNDPVLEALDERIAGALVTCVRASRDWAYTNPYLVRHMPSHLALRPEQKGLNNLLLNFDWIQARLNLSGIQALLSDYLLCRSAYPATARLHRTLSMIAHILRDHPDQLIAQLLGRIEPGVPDITPLLDGKPGANYSLAPPSQEGLNVSQRRILKLPDLEIEHRGVYLIDRTLSLDGLLERAKASLRGSRWIPALGGLAQAGALVHTLLGHEDAVTSVALSADGHTVISGSYDHTIRLWDAQIGLPLRTLQGHEGRIQCVALSADGRNVISGGDDHTVRLWDAQSGKHLRTLKGHEDSVLSVAQSADGRMVISASCDQTVRLWNAQTGALIATLQDHDGWVYSVAVCAEGRTVASSSDDCTVRLWDARTGKLLRTLQGHEDAVNSVALSADGLTVASGSCDQTVRLWDAQTGELLRTLQGHKGSVHSVALSADGLTVVSCGRDRAVRLWNTKTGELLRVLHGHEGRIYSVAMSIDCRTVISGSDDHTVRMWDAHTGLPVSTMRSHRDLVNSVALSADGCTIVSGSDDHSVRVWDASTGALVSTLQGHEGAVGVVALSADGRLLVSGSDDGTVRLWDAPTSRLLRTLRGYEGPESKVALSVEGRNMLGLDSWVSSVALSLDGQTLVCGSRDKLVRFWNVQKGELVATLQGHEDAVGCVALSFDARTVVSGSRDRTVRLWDARTGKLLRTLQGHEGRIHSVALSADGLTVVSGSRDGTVRLWNAQTGELIRTLRGHEHAVVSVVPHSDCRTVFSGSKDNTVRRWDMRTGHLQETLTFDAAVRAVAVAEQDNQPIMAVATGSSVVRVKCLLGASAQATAQR